MESREVAPSSHISKHEQDLLDILSSSNQYETLHTKAALLSDTKITITKQGELKRQLKDPTQKAVALTEVAWRSIPNIFDAVHTFRNMGISDGDLIDICLLTAQETGLKWADSKQGEGVDLRQLISISLRGQVQRSLAEHHGIIFESFDLVPAYYTVLKDFKKINQRDATAKDLDSLLNIVSDNLPNLFPDLDKIIDSTQLRNSRRRLRQNTQAVKRIHSVAHQVGLSVNQTDDSDTEMEDNLFATSVMDEVWSRNGNKLNERELEVLSLRYSDGMTLEEVGKMIGLTRERVRQIELKALRKLRNNAGLVSRVEESPSTKIDTKRPTLGPESANADTSRPASHLNTDESPKTNEMKLPEVWSPSYLNNYLMALGRGKDFVLSEHQFPTRIDVSGYFDGTFTQMLEDPSNRLIGVHERQVYIPSLNPATGTALWSRPVAEFDATDASGNMVRAKTIGLIRNLDYFRDKRFAEPHGSPEPVKFLPDDIYHLRQNADLSLVVSMSRGRVRVAFKSRETSAVEIPDSQFPCYTFADRYYTKHGLSPTESVTDRIRKFVDRIQGKPEETDTSSTRNLNKDLAENSNLVTYWYDPEKRELIKYDS